MALAAQIATGAIMLTLYGALAWAMLLERRSRSK